eukprot:TRINITY_DN1213_c1_g1_i1.p1 TRINITY_DN1213_c1_g1~~TRINITY_DN1213_c1_g1_i1.p1  ORF type:complete len:485 (-),score=24.25 TRINITY_DN1213_c1_g1_i1:385-1809(-)
MSGESNSSKKQRSSPIEHAISFDTYNENEVYNYQENVNNLETPLLVNQNELAIHAGGSISSTTLNLTKTIVGAGIVALPHAVQTYGILVSIIILVFVAYFVQFSLISLVRLSEETKIKTYPGSIQAAFGRPVMYLLQLSIICYNLGMMIVYLIVIGDVLVGTKTNNYDGLITGWADIHTGNVWYVSKPFILAVIVVIMIPALILKQINKLASISAFGMALAFTFALCIVILFIVKAIKFPSTLDSRLFPDPELLKMDRFTITTQMLSTLGVFLTAFMCHYNLHPLMEELKDYSTKRMAAVIDLSITITAVVYFLVSVGGFAVFGVDTQGDVLKNFSDEYLPPIIGQVGSQIMFTVVRIGYCIVLMTTYPLVLFSLRQRLLDFVTQQQLKQVMWWVTTALCVVLTYVLAVLLPNIQVVIQFVGCTAAVVMAFMLPALGSLYVNRKRCWDNFISAVLLLLGALLFVIGFQRLFTQN